MSSSPTPGATLQSVRGEASSALEQELAALDPWFHNLHLPDGTQTAPNHPLGDFPNYKWQAIAPHLPLDLRGWTVLDIGCNAGFYSFELARRGAQVDAIDMDPRYLHQAQWARRQLGLEDRVRLQQASIYDLAHDEQRYDLVWFMGVFYHLRYPLLGLDIVARKTQRYLVFQTLSLGQQGGVETPANLPYAERQRLNEPGWPRAAFIEHAFAGDATNWWVPNASACEALLRSAGFHHLRSIADETWLCEAPRAGHLPSEDYRALFGER